MNIELATASETAPVEILDLQVLAGTSSGKSSLSLRLLLRKDRKTTQLHVPTLSWFDASQLQRFAQDLAHFPENCQITLLDAGVRLTASVRGLAERWSASRSIRIEPLPSSTNQFAAFTVHTSTQDIKMSIGKLNNRLWEVFTRG